MFNEFSLLLQVVLLKEEEPNFWVRVHCVVKCCSDIILVDFMYWRNHAHKAFFQVAEIADLKSPLTVPFFPTPKGEHFIDNSQEADLFDYINQFFRPKKNKQQNVNDSTTNS
jgi:hypothetical protein